jgi:tetratricopeptide (TPR) repeat protein
MGRLEKLATQRSPDILAALGVGHLVTGDIARAVSALEESIDQPNPRPNALSDLSAAYLVRAMAPQHSQDLLRALTFAERAIQIAPNKPEPWFNRALSLEALSLYAAARDSWQTYLRFDAQSGWADEAREHLRSLDGTHENRLVSTRHEVDDMIDFGDSAAIVRAVETSSQTVRDAIERRLLDDWPRLLLDGKTRNASALLNTLAEPALVLARKRKDAFYVDCINAARRAAGNPLTMTALARAHQSYRAAVEAYNDDRIAESARRMKDLAAPLERAGTPLAWSARRYVAIGLYYANDYRGALKSIRTVRDNPATQAYSRLRGLAWRLSGLIHVNRGEFSVGLADYQEAQAFFGTASDIDNQASMYSLIAEDYAFLGDSVPAWQAWRSALQRVDLTQERRSRYVILQAAAYAALRDDFPEAAFHLQEAALDNAHQWSRPPAVLAGILNRAEILKRLGQNTRAMDSLGEAERYLASVQDPLLTSRNEARILLARGETLGRERPAEAIDALTKALAFFERTGTSWRLAGTYLARGRAYLAAKHDDLAEQDFLSGISVFERMRASISTEALRSSYFEQPWDLFTEMIRLQLSRHNTVKALRFAEQARARTLLDALSPKASVDVDLPADVGRALPPGVTVLYFSSLEDHLLIWTLSRDRSAFAEEPVRQADIARWLARYGDGGIGRDGSALALYDHLIRPVRNNLPDGESLVIVPDGILHGVPFAGLVHRETGRYLVQEHAIVTSPSLLMFLRSMHASTNDSIAGFTGARALVVGNPRLNDVTTATLPDAEREARDIAALYEDSTLLLGEAATKGVFMASAGTYDVVHFAGHAVSNDDYPGLSQMLLSGGNNKADGTLFAHEITGMAFNRTRLVVLAACRTRTGRVRRGEGVFSLARPFLAAGVPTVIASLWDVDDRATRELFVVFHRTLSKGLAPADALRTAQLAMLAHGDESYRGAFNWASFAVIGGAQALGHSSSPLVSH